MADPTLALQGAIVAAVKTVPAVAGGRIYDSVPPSPTFPYLTIGEISARGADNDCWDASDVFVSIDVWSTAVGKPEARTAAALVRERLKQEFTLSGFKVTEAVFVSITDVGDPDPLITHLVVEFLYLIDHDN